MEKTLLLYKTELIFRLRKSVDYINLMNFVLRIYSNSIKMKM